MPAAATPPQSGARRDPWVSSRAARRASSAPWGPKSSAASTSALTSSEAQSTSPRPPTMNDALPTARAASSRLAEPPTSAATSRCGRTSGLCQKSRPSAWPKRKAL